MSNSKLETENIKKNIYDFYENQSAEKTESLKTWLTSGTSRIPQSKSYYYFEDRKIKNALKMANLHPGSRILEIGCNLGQMTFPLAEKKFEVVGFDLSKNAIDKASQRAQYYKIDNVRFEVQDAETYKGHKDETFDAAFSFSAFRYFPNPDNALAEACRVLKKNGVIVIDFPNKFCPWFNILKRTFFIKPHIHDTLYSKQQIREMMEKAGFKDITFEIFLFSYKELPPVLLPLMKLADFILERMPVIKNTAAILMVRGYKK
jgi:ubiquinone/menaquinone biosynthesis C-methylase UbiE